jgi:uncharacterized membrane protein YtjA (UPF0391 family)
MACSNEDRYIVIQNHIWRKEIMFSWVILLFVIAIIAGILGFGGIAASAASAAKVVFFVALVLAVLGFFVGRRP